MSYPKGTIYTNIKKDVGECVVLLKPHKRIMSVYTHLGYKHINFEFDFNLVFCIKGFSDDINGRWQQYIRMGSNYADRHPIRIAGTYCNENSIDSIVVSPISIPNVTPTSMILCQYVGRYVSFEAYVNSTIDCFMFGKFGNFLTDELMPLKDQDLPTYSPKEGYCNLSNFDYYKVPINNKIKIPIKNLLLKD